MTSRLLFERLLAEWRNLQPRERGIIVTGTIIAFVLLFYTFTWLPMQRDLARLRVSVPKAHAQLALMRLQARQVARLQTPASSASDTGNLLTRLERSALERGLRENITRMEPDDNDSARVSLDGVNFNALLSWLADLQRQNGVRAASATITAQREAGTVNVRLLLRRPGA